MEINKLVNISQYTTFRMGAQVRYFGVVKTAQDLIEGSNFAKSVGLPIFILGSGSNIIFTETDIFEAVVLKIELLGIEILEETESEVTLKIGAGEIWDNVVKYAVRMNLWGIEAMSWIPGTAGATPIQNVGAYGSEIGDVLIYLEAYDISTQEINKYTNEQCEFKYRDSIFKHSAKDKCIITAIVIKLSKIPAGVPNYPGVKKYFEDRSILNPTLEQVREAIISIREFKLPDPKSIASVGSFFKNPIVIKEKYESLKSQFPEIIAFALENGDYKIGAGWLLESLGLKGKQFGNLQFYPNNALVLTNLDNATFAELTKLVEETKLKVKKVFGIELEVEPFFI